MKITIHERRYHKTGYKYILTDEREYQESETWYLTFCNLMLYSMKMGKRVKVVKVDNKIVKSVLISNTGEYKTIRDFKFD